MIEKEILNIINQEIRRQFPYLTDVEPQITNVKDDLNQLVYKGQAKTENNVPLKLIVRVLVNSSGKILKLSTSR